MSIEGRLRQILRDDARLMDDYGDSIGRAANAIFRLRRSLQDAIDELEGMARANDSDYARPNPSTLAWLRDTMEATK